MSVRYSSRSFAIVAVAAALALTGCSQFSEQTTTNVTYAPSDGVQADIGTFGVRNLMVLTDGVGGPAALMGTVFNNGQADVDATIEGPSGLTGTVTVPAGERIALDATMISTTSADEAIAPGRLVDVAISAGADSVSLRVPVLDGVHSEYASVVPTAEVAQPSAVPGEPAPVATSPTATP